MIFYQTTTQTVNQENLIDAILLNQKNSEILNLNFIGYPNVQTIREALSIIESKRLRLRNPYNHNFLCINMYFEPELDFEDMTDSINKAAIALNKRFHNDLYIISLVYVDDSEQMHSMLILSDIEKSLNMSSTYRLKSELVQEIFANALQNFYISPASNLALFAFRGYDCELPYDGVYHVQHTVCLNTAQ